MQTSLFISLIVATIVGIILPIIFLMTMFLMKRLKFIPFIKGVMMSIVVNNIFLPVLLTFFSKQCNVTSIISINMFYALIFYSAIVLVIQYVIFKKVFDIPEENDMKYHMILGYGFCYAFSLIRTIFENLVIGDHIRIHDYEYLSAMGIKNVTQVVQFYNTHEIGYFLSIGIQVIIVIAVQFLLIYLFNQYIKYKNKKSIIISYTIILLIQMMLYMSIGLKASYLLVLTLIFLGIIIFMYKKFYGNNKVFH